MTKPSVASNRTKIEVNEANIEHLRSDVGDIKDQVSNHIPTSIKDIDDKLDSILYKLGGLIATVAIILQLIK